uniref:Cyclic nucleotide-binding domain-containing protein n=1 Tax=Arcella intermedia TaxID=1963864 RepID=A0A6B2L0J8_9EUKA
MNDRLGDPICDQFCLERFQNRTIFALADGCNWGPKVRATAKLAAQTFVEYCKKTIFEVETTQATMKAFLQSFGHIHNRIIEGKESTWWECATTTLLGGCLLEVNDPDHKWAFLCLSVGDCKAYHITTRSNKISVADITQGSRTGKGSLDARDCGGRLGPYKKGGHPDLRNLAAFFEYVEEDDFILLMTDGVYDNLDPQSLGIPIEETGLKTNLKGSDWSLFADVDDEQLLHDIEEYKTKYMVDTVRDLVEESLKEKGITFHELQAEQIAEKLINQALKITKNSRVYMEQHPGEPQPVDYKAFPGKVDHTTCIVMKVSSTNFRQWEVDLSDLVVRLRHPTYGITKEAEGIQKGTFQGKDLETWINQDPEYSETGEDFPQALMNFNYISTVTNQDSYIYETFNPDLLYQFKVHVPIMTNRDWKAILQGTARKSFSRGEVIISEGENQSNIYHITFGTCKVRKQITTSQPSLKPKKDWMPRRLNSGQVKTESRENSTQFKILGTIGAPQTLGEISLLLNTKATASVIADSDQVEVLVLEKNFMNIMFVRYPDMAGRFYHYLASILARRLGFHESD